MNMDLKGKRLLILGGSRISCEIVRHARAMGIVTGVTDWYPLEKSPAKQAADEAYYVNTTDIDAMAELVREKKFDGVFTGFTDSVLPYYADICERVGFPAYGTREQFELFIDKTKYKALMREFDVPTIPEFTINTDRFDESVKDIVFPVIVKPADSSGSRGITVCENAEELKKAISFAADTSKAKEILVEQYIDNAEATVFWLFVDGRYYMILLGNRHIKHNQEGELPLPAGYTYPAAVQPKFLAEVAPKMEKMFRSVGIKDGMMFMQCKIVDGTCVVYDIGYRLTGSLEYINLKGVCGYDPLDMMIRFALTGSMEEPDIDKKADPYLGGAYAYNVSLLCRPGKIAEIRGLEEIRKLPGVLEAVVAHPVGDVITEAMKGRLAQITVRILGRAADIESMKNEMLKIQELAHVISDTGEEMILPGLEESDFTGTIYEQ
ncbi:MAG: ATP-grasp domain-containing protein [Lachnospiraceae bacterium]|nr:ATP-grasp domain-containing protein [Lachnospiraceae bacterium]